jgi:hypothetical protein
MKRDSQCDKRIALASEHLIPIALLHLSFLIDNTNVESVAYSEQMVRFCIPDLRWLCQLIKGMELSNFRAGKDGQFINSSEQ